MSEEINVEGQSSNQFVVFELGSEEFGIEITKIQEIIKVKETTELPETPDFIEGIIKLRGKIITVVDLRKQLGYEVNNNSDNRIIIVEIDGDKVGCIVDKASEVENIEKDMISNPEGISRNTKDLLRGVAKLEDSLILLLDINKLISSEQKEELAEQLSDVEVQE